MLHVHSERSKTSAFKKKLIHYANVEPAPWLKFVLIHALALKFLELPLLLLSCQKELLFLNGQLVTMMKIFVKGQIPLNTLVGDSELFQTNALRVDLPLLQELSNSGSMIAELLSPDKHRPELATDPMELINAIDRPGLIPSELSVIIGLLIPPLSTCLIYANTSLLLLFGPLGLLVRLNAATALNHDK